jgi:hypothetical protein
MSLNIGEQFKLFLIRLATFLILFFVIDFIIGGMMRRAYFSQKNKYTYGIQQSKEEVIIVGSSRAQHHYIPSIITDSLGLTCYNMGSGGQNIYYSYGIIKSILQRYSPKVILLELMYIDYAITDAAHNTDNLSLFLPYCKYNETLNEVINLRGPFEKVKLLSQAYPFNSMATDIVYSFVKRDKNVYFANNGYVPIEGEISLPLEKFVNKDELKVDTLKTKYIEKTIDLCNYHKVRLIIIVSPTFRDSEGKTSSVKIVQRIASKAGIEFWNYELDSLFLFEKTLFKDVSHLNHIGAEKYTRIVAGRIKNMRGLDN